MSNDWEPDNPLADEQEAEWREQSAIADEEAAKAQPPAPQPTDSGETYEELRADFLLNCLDDLPGMVEDALDQVVAAAVQAEHEKRIQEAEIYSKELLANKKWFEEQLTSAVQAAQVKTLDYVEQQIIGKDPATQRRKLMAVRALLDGERRKDYPPILTSEVYPALTDEERRRIGEKL